MIVLIIEDLHWADQSSINLLFHLVRSLKQEKILLLGTYRPEDIKIGIQGNRHPFDAVLNGNTGDTVATLQSILIRSLSSVGLNLLTRLIDAEPNQLKNEFRKRFFDITEGNALFSTEMLYYLKENGYLYKRRMASGFSTRFELGMLPSRVEAVIRERFDRLSEELKQTLTIASVEGKASPPR